MANFSSKKLMMKNPSGQKKKTNTQYSPSKPGTFKNAFREARADNKKTFMWNGNKYTTELATDKKKKEDSKTKSKKTSTVKIIRSDKGKGPLAKFLKKPKSTIDKRGKQLQRMAQQKMTAEDNIKRQIDAAKKPKKKQSVITSSYNKKPNANAMSYKKGGGNVFVAKQYGGKII
jgi:hypothetical protein